MRILMLVLGAIAIAMGLLWIGQGAGIVRWPASSFMIAQRQWMLWGAVLTIVGIGIVLASRRVGVPRR